jgi:hypothetical protein
MKEHGKKKRDPDLRWSDSFDKKAKSEGWSLFTTDGTRCEILRLDESDIFDSDDEAVYFAYQAALRHEPHARAAFTMSLQSIKKEA